MQRIFQPMEKQFFCSGTLALPCPGPKPQIVISLTWMGGRNRTRENLLDNWDTPGMAPMQLNPHLFH
jgi:hypothetical protein